MGVETKHKPEHLKIEDIMTLKEEPAAEIREDLENYFKVFAAPVVVEDKQVCPSCGEPFGGLMANLGIGVGIEWGIAHGEGYCNGCRWPYRGHHSIKDRHGEELMNIQNLFLAYHPDHVEKR